MHKRQCQGPFRLAHPLILASASPRRRELLCALGLEFDVLPSTDEEPEPLPGELPYIYVQRVCEAKAAGIARRHPGSVTLAADTIVVLGDEILGKPEDEADALDMLERLSGRSHQVYTAGIILWPEMGEKRTFLQETKVWIRRYPVEVLKTYIDSGEPLDKAGSYAIQGIGAFLVERIQGSYTNVVGLPLDEVVMALTSLGVLDICKE